MTAESLLNPTFEPVPRRGLHFDIEFVGRVIHSAILPIWNPGLLVTGLDLLECVLDAIRMKQAIAGTVDDHQGTRGNQGREVREIQIVVQPWYVESQTHSVDDVPAHLLRPRGHPSDPNGNLDSRIERRQHVA